MPIFYLLYLVLMVIPAPKARELEWKTIETINYDWRPGSGLYALAVEELEGDPDNLSRLRVKVKGQPDFVLNIPGGITDVGDGLKNERVTAQNLLHSQHFYFSPKLRDRNGSPMLLIFGKAYGSAPGSFYIFSLNQRGYPVKILEVETFSLADIVDLDGDGVAEIIGKQCLSQYKGKCHITYDPYSVYHLPRTAPGQLTLSLALSKSYNLKHYYGWAGPKCREDVMVALCGSGATPRIMSVEETKRFVDK